MKQGRGYFITGTGAALTALLERYPSAQLCALDCALAMVERARDRIPWWRRWFRHGVLPVCGDIEQLPLRAGTVALIWSNLALQWLSEPARAFVELRRVLAPGGLLMFSTFGPDTLKELRAAYSSDGYVHVHRFIDMHDLGDMLLAAGYSAPVMDIEYITLTYADVMSLMRDLKAIGARNAAIGRRPGMTPRAALAALTQNYEAMRTDGSLPATFEVVYGHAWSARPPNVTAEGRPIIPINRARSGPP